MNKKLEKLLKALYDKQDKNNGWLSEREDGMKDILSMVLDKDESILDELLEDEGV